MNRISNGINKEKLRQVNKKLKEKKDNLVHDLKESLQYRETFPDVIPYSVQCSAQQENIYTIPNLLCIIRIVFSPWVGYLIVSKEYWSACVLSVIIALTDFFDGYIARKFPSQASVFGSYLDPLADKISIATLFVSLYSVNLISGFLTLIVLIRDVYLFLAGAYIRYESLDPPRTVTKYFKLSRTSAQLSPLYISKVNTALQFVLVGGNLLSLVSTLKLRIPLEVLSWCVAGTTITSGVMYAISMHNMKTGLRGKPLKNGRKF